MSLSDHNRIETRTRGLVHPLIETLHPDTSFAYSSHDRFRLSNVTHLPTTTRHNLNLLDSAIIHQYPHCNTPYYQIT